MVNSVKPARMRTALSSTKLALLIISGFFIIGPFLPSEVHAQSNLKKVRLALPTKTVSFLAFYAAYHKSFYRDEGIELEQIIMQPALASTAVLTGDIDYNGAVTGVIGGAVRGRPMKALLFTVARPTPVSDEQKGNQKRARTQGQKDRRQFSRRNRDFPHGDAFKVSRIRS
jgi:ABC-type nitrate/sulfonate/bicarbonate transport system substrate-binding protein